MSSIDSFDIDNNYFLYNLDNRISYNNQGIDEDSQNENNENSFIYKPESNENDEKNELMNKKEEKDTYKQQIGLISPKQSQKSTNDSEKKETAQKEKPNINAASTNYENQSRLNKSKKNIEKETKNLLSHKKNRSAKNNSNNKYMGDYIVRKCKHLTLKAIFNLINKKIIKFYNGKIGNGIFKRQLKKLCMKQKSEPTIKFNQEFLYKSIFEIFSDKISPKYSNYNPEFNKQLIQSLMNENNIEIKIYFTKLFRLTFLQCLEHYCSTKNYEELNEMRVFNDEKKNMEDKDYVENLDYYLKNYEEIIKGKKSRKSKERKKNRKIKII